MSLTDVEVKKTSPRSGFSSSPMAAACSYGFIPTAGGAGGWSSLPSATPMLFTVGRRVPGRTGPAALEPGVTVMAGRATLQSAFSEKSGDERAVARIGEFERSAGELTAGDDEGAGRLIDLDAEGVRSGGVRSGRIDHAPVEAAPSPPTSVEALSM